MKFATTQTDVEKILSAAADLSRRLIKSGDLVYQDGTKNEKALYEVIRSACNVEGFNPDSAELVGGHKFPDVVFADARIGVEIKGHVKGDRILGNSIMGSTPSLNNPLAIYLFSWNASESDVIWRDYFESVVGAEVTHSPRFVLNPKCEPEQSLFGEGPNQIGKASDVCLGENGIQSEIILARMRANALAAGNIPWWISAETEIQSKNQQQGQLAIVRYSNLDARPDGERMSFLKTILIGFPEILGKSARKYDDALVWGIVKKGVLISRDAFTAGGRVDELVPEICNVKPISIPQVLSRARKILQSKSQFRVTEIEEIWQEQLLVEEDLRKILKRKMIESGIGQHARLSLHKNCNCSDISNEQFSTNIANWLLKDFETNSLFVAK
jgi:hypothetical protein